jgi:sigma-B regulation protein RsbU (phosphoserine phosphatase)
MSPPHGGFFAMTSQSTTHMQCMEVWGGSQLTSRSVTLGGLEACVFSKPYGEAQRGGDVYYASSCATGRITRLLLADVAGHGHSVAATAADLRTLMRRFVNRLDQSEFVRLLNQQFADLSKEGTFATALVTTFFAPSRRLTVCNAGHPRPLLYRHSPAQWNLLGHEPANPAAKMSNVPLGMFNSAEYEHFDVELEPGDCFITYSDALIESRDADGEMLGEEGLLRILRLLGNNEPQTLITSLLHEITERYSENLSHDDVTVMVVRANGEEPQFSFREKLAAIFRFFAALLGSINPRAERPPMPDFTVPNVGGAIFPALGRRWRAPKP